MLSVDPTVSFGAPPSQRSVPSGEPSGALVPAGATDGVFSVLLDDRVWGLPGLSSWGSATVLDGAPDLPAAGDSTGSVDGGGAQDAGADAGREGPVQPSPDAVTAPTFDVAPRLPPTAVPVLASTGGPPEAHRSSLSEPVTAPPSHGSSPSESVTAPPSPDGVEARTVDVSPPSPTTDLPAFATTGGPPEAHRSSPLEPVPVHRVEFGADPAATLSSDRSMPFVPGSAFGTERVVQPGPGRPGVDRASSGVRLESVRLAPGPVSGAALVPDVQTVHTPVGVVPVESASQARPDGPESTIPGRAASVGAVVPANEAAVGAAPVGAHGLPGEPTITSLPFAPSSLPPVPDGPVTDGRLSSAASALPGPVSGIPDGPTERPVRVPGAGPGPAQTGDVPPGGLPVSGELSLKTTTGPTTPVRVPPTAFHVEPRVDDGAVRIEIERQPASVSMMPAPLIKMTRPARATARLTQSYLLDGARASAGEWVGSTRAEAFDIESPATRDRMFDLDAFDAPSARSARGEPRPSERVLVETFRKEGRSVDRALPLGVTAPGAVSPSASGLFAAAPLGAPPRLSSAVTTPLDHTLPPTLVRSAQFLMRQGGGEARIRLHPDHLGEIVMTVKVDQGTVIAELQVDSEAARGWIRAHQHLLRAALAEQGLGLDRFTVTDRDQRDARDPRDPRAPRDEPAPRRRSPSSESTDARFDIRV